MDRTEQELVHRHEHSDVAPRWPVYVGVAMLLLMPLAVAFVAFLMSTLWSAPPTRPDLFPGEQRVVDAPRLQVHPQADLAAVRAEWHKRLTSYGWVDRSRGIVQIPINVAMHRLASQGLEQATQSSPLEVNAGTGAGQSDQTETSQDHGQDDE